MDLVGLLVAGAAAAFAALFLASLLALSRWWGDRRRGQLVSVDDGIHPSTILRSGRYGLVGRPDELRRRRDGRLVPIEWKSRDPPRGGVPFSHRTQLAAYCLLVEQTTGAAPPYGVVRYRGGQEYQIDWDDRTRDELLSLLDEVRRPYRGAARASPPKCLACRWRAGCDARAA